MRPLSLVVSLGTDHHRFERLLDWTERWIEASGLEVELFAQHGSTRAPRTGTGATMLTRPEMLRRYRDADVIVTQVGPGTILDVAALGRVPIVVPRLPELREHVDRHQVVFGRFMAGRGEALLAEDEAAFRLLVDRVVQRPALARRTPRPSPAPQTAAALAAVVDEVLARPAGFVSISRIRVRLGRAAARRPATSVPTMPSSEGSTREVEALVRSPRAGRARTAPSAGALDTATP